MMDDDSLKKRRKQQPNTEDRARTCCLSLGIMICGVLPAIEYVDYYALGIPYEFSYELAWLMARGGIVCMIPGFEQRSAMVMLKGGISGALVRVVIAIVTGLLCSWNTRTSYNPAVLDILPPHIPASSHGALFANPWALVVGYSIWMLSFTYVWAVLWKVGSVLRVLCWNAIFTVGMAILLVTITPWHSMVEFEPVTAVPYPPLSLTVQIVLFLLVPLCFIWLRVLIRYERPVQQVWCPFAGLIDRLGQLWWFDDQPREKK